MHRKLLAKVVVGALVRGIILRLQIEFDKVPHVAFQLHGSPTLIIAAIYHGFHEGGVVCGGISRRSHTSCFTAWAIGHAVFECLDLSIERTRARHFRVVFSAQKNSLGLCSSRLGEFEQRLHFQP